MGLKATLVALTLFISSSIYATTVEHRLYINAGIYTAVDSATFPMAAFNQTPQFTARNTLITLSPDDSLDLWVINTDSVTHGFRIEGHTSTDIITAGDSVHVVTHFSNDNYSTIYSDPTANSSFRAAGLAGIIHVSSKSTHLFYWNIKEFQKSWAEDLILGQSVNWSGYNPDYFTINGQSNPHINEDSTARVVGTIGDHIQIIMANTGVATHSLHFHGYHATVVFSSAHPTHVGRSKDTFPIKPMESLIVELVPDKPGEYPVHDHNLVAVSAGGIYPNGMFLTMKIE